MWIYVGMTRVEINLQMPLLGDYKRLLLFKEWDLEIWGCETSSANEIMR